jgi:hypothetical protein
MDIGAVTVDDFAGRIGEAFTVTPGDGSELELRLVEVEAAAQGASPGGRTPFSLILTGGLDTLLLQGIHQVEHPELGAAGIFIVPLGPQGDAMRYEIVIS